MSQIAKLKAQITKYANLVKLGCKKYIINLIDTEAKLESLYAESTKEAHAEVLTVWTNRNKGINAYLINAENSANSADIYYGKPIDKESMERSHRGKSHQVSFNLGNIPDGIYRLKECCGSSWHKHKTSFLVISQGKILKTVDKLEDLVDQSLLPDLEGSEKQVQWAKTIRAKFLSDCDRCGVEYPQWVLKTKSAKWWIENRHEMKAKVPLPIDITIF